MMLTVLWHDPNSSSLSSHVDRACTEGAGNTDTPRRETKRAGSNNRKERREVSVI